MAQIAGSPATARVDTSGSPYGVILKLAAPTVLAMLTQSIVNEIDIIFFAHLPYPESSNGQAALLPSLILLWVFGGSLSPSRSVLRPLPHEGLRSGGTRMRARFWSTPWRSPHSPACYLQSPGTWWCRAARVAEVQGVRDAAEGYIRWRLLGITSMAVTFAFKAFFDGIGKTTCIS